MICWILRPRNYCPNRCFPGTVRPGVRIHRAILLATPGKAAYEAEFEYGDIEIELEIDANGKLLSKKVSRKKG